MSLFPPQTACDLRNVALCQSEHVGNNPLSVFSSCVQSSDFFGIFLRDLSYLASPDVFGMCHYLKMIGTNARRVFAKVIQLIFLGDGPMLSFVKHSMGPSNTVRLAIPKLSVIFLTPRSLPYPAGRDVPTVTFFPPFLFESKGVPHVDISARTVANTRMRKFGISGGFGPFTASAPTKPIGYVRARSLPVGAVFFRRAWWIGYIVHKLHRLFGVEPRRVTSTASGQFGLSMPNYNIEGAF